MKGLKIIGEDGIDIILTICQLVPVNGSVPDL